MDRVHTCQPVKSTLVELVQAGYRLPLGERADVRDAPAAGGGPGRCRGLSRRLATQRPQPDAFGQLGSTHRRVGGRPKRGPLPERLRTARTQARARFRTVEMAPKRVTLGDKAQAAPNSKHACGLHSRLVCLDATGGYSIAPQQICADTIEADGRAAERARTDGH